MYILIQTLSKGYEFSQTWPKNEPYLAQFTQTKAVKLANLSLTLAPIMAALTAALQFNFYGKDVVNYVLAISLMFLSMPIQGYYLLGKQAEQSLPLGLQNWYREIEQKLKENALANSHYDNEVEPQWISPKSKPTYFDLAKVLKSLFS